MVAVMCVVAGSLAMPARADDEDPLQAMLDQTDLKYRVLDESSYIIPFEIEVGEDYYTLYVFLTYNNEDKKFALMFCTILDYEDATTSARDDAARLRINNDFPAISSAFDADNGDLTARRGIHADRWMPITRHVHQLRRQHGYQVRRGAARARGGRGRRLRRTQVCSWHNCPQAPVPHGPGAFSFQLS